MITKTDLQLSGYKYFDSWTDKSHCNCESICRCGEIIIKGRSDEPYTPDDLHTKLIFGTKKQNTDLSKAMYEYGLHRISRILYVDELEEPEIRRGYYGDEMGSCFPINANTIVESTQEFLGCSTEFEALMYLIELEYGYVAPSIEKYKDVERITVQRDDIHPVPEMIKNNPYLKTKYPDDIPLMVVRDGTIRVDGRHRLHMAHVNGIEEFEAWDLCGKSE